ncbi:alpha/beta hydrolase [Oculatella sp. LEGE 06141]|uniref:alpha/beta fold hydrolase n=1 Tax=Oculatella sp. LEGE 06141 TaxID=1828648 RepID=UPI001882A5E8|nr:alpha/beta hydrolase [Oculatella sp. LEGE 06141]MBE9179070.1 alpha/beta hydrolase [Oculatella sp. LEGE 06141]
MSNMPDVLWLNTSPSLKCFERPVLNVLSKHYSTYRWDYEQTPDEASCLEIALVLLHDYLKQGDRSVHLVGHGTAGVLGLLYARRYPERVKSLSLLSVGAHPAIDWHAHYYAQRQLLPCSRELILAQMARMLFGSQNQVMTRCLVQRLADDLDQSLSLHTLFKRTSLEPGGAPVPVLVCAGEHDAVVNPNEFYHWQHWLKHGDSLWQCPNGRHFFHYAHPDLLAEQLLQFWSRLNSTVVRAGYPAFRLEA